MRWNFRFKCGLFAAMLGLVHPAWSAEENAVEQPPDQTIVSEPELPAPQTLDATETSLPAPPPSEEQALEERVQALKRTVLELNRDLFLLEEELLFPANTQFTVFVSFDAAQLFSLDAVELRIDDKVVADYLYTEHELAALRRGGVQRLYQGNLRSGEHELVAYFIGKGPQARDYRRGATIKFEKKAHPQFVEMKIKADAAKQQPEFEIKVWE